jgi:hypothetical protein
MLEGTPPGLDRRVGEGDLGHREKSFQYSGVDQFVNSGVEVLDATVGQQRRPLVDETLRGVQKQFGCRARVERCGYVPRENASREVVDDRSSARLLAPSGIRAPASEKPDTFNNTMTSWSNATSRSTRLRSMSNAC